MSPQKSSQSSPKLHQYFQDIDLSDSPQATWTSTQSIHSQPVKCLEALNNGTICLSDSSGAIFTGPPHQLDAIHTPNTPDTISTYLATDSSCQHLASCSNHTTVKLLNLSRLDQKARNLRFPEPIHCSAFYSDDLNGCSAMIGGGLRNVWLMDVEAGKVFQKFGDWRLKTKKVVGVMRVGNGCLLVSQHVDKSLEVWDLRLPNRPIHIVKPLLDSAGPISSTSHIGTNGRFLVRASNAGRLLVEELLTGKLIAQIQLQDKVGAVRFADDRQNGEKACYLAAASINGQYVCEINGGGHKLKSIKNAEKTSKIKWIAEKTEFVSISNGNCVNYFQLTN